MNTRPIALAGPLGSVCLGFLLPISACQWPHRSEPPRALIAERADSAIPSDNGPDGGEDARAALSLVLSPRAGDGPSDAEIRRWQAEVTQMSPGGNALENLGFAFLSKARQSFDPGFYLHAEACAVLMESRGGNRAQALLLRGMAYHAQHRFSEAETLARRLVEMRGLPHDFGLLGDALMESGRLPQALDAYQKMLDLKPGLQAYARAAHMRWLKGDLPGALDAMAMAVQAGSMRDSESMAWAHSQFALYRLQAGQSEAAQASVRAALDARPLYPPALFVRGKIMLARGKPDEAVQALSRAVRGHALPEYQWALRDAWLEAGHPDEADRVERKLLENGMLPDPRGFALFLATLGRDPSMAVNLAKRELVSRGDVFSHDALAWSLHAAGSNSAAGTHMRRALAEGTRDARLYFHAGMLSLSSGRRAEARQRLEIAASMRQMLLPSEWKQVRTALADG